MANRSVTMQRLVFGAGMAVGLSAWAAPAMAYDDGYQNVFSSVLTAVGVIGANKTPDIDYRERPPLVLPPKMVLAKPVKNAAHPASWPQDPDVIKARKADEAARAPMEDGFANSRNGVLSKDELLRGRGATTEDVQAPHQCGGFGQSDAHCLVLSPDELKAQGDRYEAANPTSKNEVTAGAEPDRLYLTQPPKGYLKATKTIKATTEAPEPKIDESNPSAALVYRPKPDEQ